MPRSDLTSGKTANKAALLTRCAAGRVTPSRLCEKDTGEDFNIKQTPPLSIYQFDSCRAEDVPAVSNVGSED